ncbi:hypothetical protein FOA52_004900 [Chlamydomonas sp. UWO 241]|nr:hypothetical protein FOA52_004900 [Chlamydomonas sp. UWO 241]
MQIDVPEAGVSGQRLDAFGPSFPCAKLKLDQFFLQWLAEHQDTVASLLEDVQAGRPVRTAPSHASTSGHSPSPLSPSAAHVLFSGAPPLSPSKNRSPGSPISPFRRSMTASSLKRRSTSSIPSFYVPKSTPEAEELAIKEWEAHVEGAFAPHPGGMPEGEFIAMADEVCEIPRMVARALFARLATTELLPKAVFIDFWLSRKLATAPQADRVFHSLKKDGQEYLTYADFQPVMDNVLAHHPGLEFLKETSEFQKKYSETVVYRIFYTLNRSGSGRLTLREIRRSDLMEALELLDSEEDINKILKYFSYEHFYVIYCKFWELDSDHDFLVDRNDLAHYSQGALSYQIIDRIFEEAPRKFSASEEGKMGYEDFVWFILSEEDKTSDTALEYWFRCVDLDHDGVIRPREMWFFYEEQLRRMDTLPSAETVLFEDLVCQLHDMVQPSQEGAYTLRDFKRMSSTAGALFNALFNLHKFLAFENRDPFAARAEAAEYSGCSEWDKFARVEYCRLASEDDQEEVHMEAEDEGGLAL